MKSNNNKGTEYKKVSCPNCDSIKIIRRGKRKTLNRGLIQRYGCISCGRRFVEDKGFFKMKNSPQKITLCLDLFYRGISTRKVQEHLQAFYPQNSSNVSIYKWIVKYSKIIYQFTDNLKIKAGDEIQIDEMEYGNRKKKTHGWFIDSIDCTTRFMVSSNFVKRRSQKEIKNVIQKVKDKTDGQIRVYTTDGHKAYPKAVQSVVGYYNLKKGIIRHKKVTQLRGEGFNHKVERLHSNLRARTKTFRGFHGSTKSANAVMKGLEIYYNFMRFHQAVGCYPYELAVPELKEKLGANKWLDLIYISKEEKSLK